MKQANLKYTILYGRLSQEDERDGESNSIQNQRLMLEKYATDNGFENILFLSDDGYSGTNFNRPAWKELMKLVENDEVATIIVKDMSRLGRDYLLVGQYTEMIFPSYGVRFIAVNNNVDSLYGDNDFTPFVNLFNDFYAKDTSRKIRAVVKSKAERGERVATRAPYGYKKDESDPKRKIVPDEDAAPVVRRIFSLCAGGKGPTQIAKQLNSEQIFSPGYYYYNKTGVLLTNVDVTKPYAWNNTTVANILEDEVYLGHTISLQSTTISYKNKKRIERPKSEQLRFENTHEPLVTKETWDIVQDIRKHKRRRANMAEQNMFSGLVYCADCGETMILHRAHTMAAVKNNFMCSTYRKRGKETCSGHYIREIQLAAIVLDDLQRVTHFARQQEALFIQHINRKNSAETRREIERLQRELDVMRRRDTELSTLFKRTYEDNVLGRITNEQFRMLSADYNSEQNSLKDRIPQTVDRIEKLQASISNVSRFIDKAKRYTEINELTGELLNLFIERIEVGEREERYSRTAEQTIIIRYRDIGVLGAFAEEAKKLAG
ncbi:MAG: recombinase family protein [Thermincola sp.]|jgi:DNA invertase Pin-like site-specific DNA recombinase|nr:recombinase family protein [Thermincola sp.]MDT3702345.1 recombinase family protein [Thermincola sp.]